MNKLILVDGYSLAFRAFFAIPVDTMVTSGGQPTNALYGFTSMMVGLVEEHQPTHMAVALDRLEPTFRDQLNVKYKAHRPPTHPGLISQLELLERAIVSLGVAVVSKAGFEADDVLASLAEMSKSERTNTIVVTGDRDSFQLVEDPYVKVLYNRRGVSDYLLLDQAGVIAKAGTEASLYPFLAALRGDPSDNLPGVPGIGDKTAAKLANEYLTLDNLLANLDSLPPRTSASIRANIAALELNMALTPLVRDLELGVSLDDLVLGSFDSAKAKEFFDLIESKRLYARSASAWSYLGHIDQAPTKGQGTPFTNTLAAQRGEFFVGDQDVTRIAVGVKWHGAPGRSFVEAIALSRLAGVAGSSANDVVSLYLEVNQGDEVEVLSWLVEQLSQSELVGFALKELYRRLFALGLDVPPSPFDLGLAAYLLDASLGDYSETAVLEHFSTDVLSANSAVEKHLDQPDLFSVESFDPSSAIQASALALLVAHVIRSGIDAEEMSWLYDELEGPLLVVLAKMEATGIAVDREFLIKLQGEFAAEVRQLAESIQSLAQRSFNVNSTKQLGEVLFSDLGLRPPRKTKTGFSTDAQTLEKLRHAHPIVDEIIRYREVEKLRSTYGQSLINEVASDGRIHASFNQMVARTGRLSSENPNLHNIPIRTPEGKKFRYAFVAPEGSRLVVADYSQIELRVIAHLSQDPGLLEAFRSRTDIHTQTAARVFGVEPKHVTSHQRAKAKMVAYGLAYGMEAYGLAARLNVEVGEADAILKSFFAAFPSVRRYMDEVVAKARKLGFTETEFGRRRRIPELGDENFRVRQGAERQAMNSGIQGLAADIFKIALVALDAALDPQQAIVVLQVHDEVIVQVKNEFAQEIRAVVTKVMETSATLSVPLEVNSYVVERWGEAK